MDGAFLVVVATVSMPLGSRVAGLGSVPRLELEHDFARVGSTADVLR